MTSRDEMQALRKLPAGQFYAFGPALTDEVTLVKVGPVQTTHPKAGERAAAPTPPREKVKKILGQLADLPAEAEEEARTAGDLRAKVKQLEADLRTAKKAQPAPAKTQTKVVERAVLKDGQLARAEKLGEKLEAVAGTLLDELEGLSEAVREAKQQPPAPAPSNRAQAALHFANDGKVTKQVGPYQIRAKAPASSGAGGTLPIGERATLEALIQYPDGLRREQLTVLTGYKRSTRDAYIARLREKGHVDTAGDRIIATEHGIAVLPDARPLPTGAELRDWCSARLPAGEKVVLGMLVTHYPNPVKREDIDEPTGFKRSTRDAYLSRLAAKQLVDEPQRGYVRASDTLFDGGETP